MPIKTSSERFFLNRNMVYIVLAVLFIALIAMNLDKFTGGTVSSAKQSVSKIYVSSDPNVISKDSPTIMNGENIYITVETGSRGSKGKASIYDSTDFSELQRATAKLRYIDTNTGKVVGNCADTCSANKVVFGSYKTGADWRSGKYCVRVVDRLENKEVEACFTVR